MCTCGPRFGRSTDSGELEIGKRSPDTFGEVTGLGAVAERLEIRTNYAFTTVVPSDGH